MLCSVRGILTKCRLNSTINSARGAFTQAGAYRQQIDPDVAQLMDVGDSNVRPQVDFQKQAYIRKPMNAPSFREDSFTPFPEENNQANYLMTNFPSVAEKPFDETTMRTLAEPINVNEIEIKSDGILYLPEIRYRKILLRAFGPGGWALIPRGPHTLSSDGSLSREYALICAGRYISQARGHVSITASTQTPGSASEAAKSNALMRCCKDLGIASELWDPLFITKWRARYADRRQDQQTGRFRWFKRVAGAPTEEEIQE